MQNPVHDTDTDTDTDTLYRYRYRYRYRYFIQIHDTWGALAQAAARDEANDDHDTNGEGEVDDLINQVENVPPEGRREDNDRVVQHDVVHPPAESVNVPPEGRREENDRVVQHDIVHPPAESVHPALALTPRLLVQGRQLGLRAENSKST